MRRIRVHSKRKLTNQLNRGSVRRRLYPYDARHIDWSVPIDDQHRYMPDGYSFIDGTPLAGRLTPEQESYVTRWEVTCWFRNNHVGEHLLNQALLTLLHKTDPYHPAWRYMLHEVAEECQHMQMFNQWVRLNDDIRTKGVGNQIWGVPASMMTPFIASQAPALFWTLTLLFEAVGDDFARASHQNASGRLHPILEQIGRVHMVEEARHIAFAKDWLAHQVPRLPKLQRRLLRAVVHQIVAGAIRTGIPLRYSRQLVPFVGYKAFKRALKSRHRRELAQRIWAPPVATLCDLQLLPKGTQRAWDRSGLLPA